MEVQWKDLIERAKKDDQDAFSALYEHSYDAVYRTVKSMVKDEDTAMDIVQDAFVSGFANLDGFQPPENFIPWMRRIATNKARDWFRKKHDIAFSQLADEEDNLPEFEDENLDQVPEAVLDRSETTRLIEEILGTLSEEQRIAVGMYYYEEMPVAEIAATLGVSENTIKSRLNYGRKKIKAGVEELEKKGTKLYSLAPFPFFIWLLRCQEVQAVVGGAPAGLFGSIMAQIGAQTTSAAATAAAGGAGTAATVKGGIFASVGAKIAAGVLAVALVGGVAAGLHFVNRGNSAPEPSQNQTDSTPETTPDVNQSTPADDTQASAPETTPEIIAPETYSEGLSFKLDEDGAGYIVIGIGSCKDTEVIIPPTHEGLPVTGVGKGAFYNNDSLTSVTIPAGVESIGSMAFISCDGLVSVTIPAGVKSIESYAFKGCNNLETITLPENLTEIGNYAFMECTGLTSVTIPAGVTDIAEGTFSTCTGLTSVTIPEGVTDIGNYAFADCTSLTNLTIPESVTTFGYGPFGGCNSLTSVTIPGSVTDMGENAFYFCDSLTSVTIQEGVTVIGDGAFYGCPALTSVTIPESVTDIGGSAFSSCTSLTSVTIPESVTSIGSGAFSNCTSLTSLSIPKSVTDVGENAFSLCKSLPSVHYGGTMAEWRKANPTGSLWYYGEIVCADGTVQP